MQRIKRQGEPMLTQKLAAQLFDAKLAGTPKIENKRFLVGEHLLLRQVARTAALVLQSSDAYRRHHFRSVGREMPQRRQTLPASPSCS